MQLLCNVEIDYSLQPESVIPFKYELDLLNSVLSPAPGENQKFCYIVTGVGSDIPELKDLSHWVLGICNEITEDQLITNSITVVIDDVPQTVIFGENVELVDPDPTTGCSGLKFDFPLNKVNGVMEVCFELSSVYDIGPNAVCQKGGTSTDTGLSICGPVCGLPEHCETFTYQTATVCAPVIVTPKAVPGETRTICCGEAIVTPGERVCPSGTQNCYFTVKQKVCIEVPITFGATAEVGEPKIECEELSTEGCNCN